MIQAKGLRKFQFDLDFEDDGQVALSFLDQFGTSFATIWDVDGNGHNFFTAIAVDDQVLFLPLLKVWERLLPELMTYSKFVCAD